ncbi:MAG TPA: hypothetical protein VLW52_17715 [Opitutaceae bacterium]|nr:hypothetical protein [Opitutaceae bacterium]
MHLLSHPIHPFRRFHPRALLVLAATALAPTGWATTKGLNQIVTPDLQPEGVLSVSAQAQDARIANPAEMQFELGLTHWAEVAVFQGFRPREEIFGTEVGLWEQGPQLLTAGAVNWSTRGGGAAPVLEYGYYASRDHFIVGAIRSGGRVEGILGYSRQLTDKLLFSGDYQSGPGNAVTLGLTYNLTADVQVNPAVYFANTRPHRAMGYVVLTWSFALWH